jgi:hypothetical protein
MLQERDVFMIIQILCLQGIVYHVSNVIKKSDRQLLVLYLREGM